MHQMPATDMDILQGCFDGAMTQQELQGVWIDAGIEKMGGKGVTQGMEPRAW